MAGPQPPPMKTPRRIEDRAEIAVAKVVGARMQTHGGEEA